MIKITNIRNIGDYEDYDEIWAIVRSLKSKSDKLIQVPELAPSSRLLGTYLGLKDNGEWTEQTFQSEYVPRFLKEMNNPIAREKLAYLWQEDKSGKKICLVCFCTKESMCHRSIIAGLLQGSGANVVCDTDTDYSHYWTKYQDLDK